MSSPVLAITTSSSAPTTSSIPRASLAPPVPPAITTTGLVKTGDLDAGLDLVADVDRDDQRRELLDDPRHLERPAVHRSESLDLVDQVCELGLVGAAVTADQHVLVELVLEVRQQRRADAVKGGDDMDALGR